MHNLSRLRARARAASAAARAGAGLEGGGYLREDFNRQHTCTRAKPTPVERITPHSSRAHDLNAGYATMQRYEPSKTKRVHTQMVMHSSAHHRA
jgi:hypothetical protein